MSGAQDPMAEYHGLHPALPRTIMNGSHGRDPRDRVDDGGRRQERIWASLLRGAAR